MKNLLLILLLTLPSSCGKKNKSIDASKYRENLQVCSTNAVCSASPCEVEIEGNVYMNASCKRVSMIDDVTGKKLDEWIELKTVMTDRSGEVIHTTMRVFK